MPDCQRGAEAEDQSDHCISCNCKHGAGGGEVFFVIKIGIIVITVITIIANMDKGEEFFLYLRHHKHCRMEYDRLLGELQKMHDEQDMEGEHIQAQVFIFIAISGQDDRCNDITIVILMLRFPTLA